MYMAACGERVVSMRDFSAAKDDEAAQMEAASESAMTPRGDFFEARRREDAKDGREEGLVGEGFIGRDVLG
jgi:hypothetical protein